MVLPLIRSYKSHRLCTKFSILHVKNPIARHQEKRGFMCMSRSVQTIHTNKQNSLHGWWLSLPTTARRNLQVSSMNQKNAAERFISTSNEMPSAKQQLLPTPCGHSRGRRSQLRSNGKSSNETLIRRTLLLRRYSDD